MIRALLAFLLVICPAALGQGVIARCDGDLCVVSRDALKVLIAAAELNCGPIR